MKKTLTAFALLLGIFAGWGVRLHADGTTGFSLLIQSSGTPIGAAVGMNCGTNLTCSLKGGFVQVSASASGGGYSTIQNQGSNLPQETTLNFTGAGVTCSDTSPSTTCNVPGGGGGGSSVNVIQSVGCRGNPVTTCAFGQNVTSGHLCIAALGWTGTTASNPTATDSVGTTYTVKVGLNGTSVSNVAVLAGVCGGTGANTITVTWPAGSGFEGIHPIEAQGVSGTTDGTATGSISSNTQDYASIASITTGTAGDLVIMVVDGQNSTPGIDVACYSMTAQVAFSQGEDSGGVCAVIQNAAGAIANGAYNNSGLGYSIAMVALKHS